MYAWEDEGVVLAIISFWASVCDVLQGSWQSNQQSNQSNQQQQCPVPEGGLTTNSHLQEPTGSHNSEQHQQQQQQDRQMSYISWMWHLGYPCLSAVVALLHQFHCLTGICQMQSKQRSTQLHLLLVFLQLGADVATANSSSSSSSSRASPAQQLLQAARWSPGAQHGGYPASNSAAANIAAVLKPGEAFAAVVKLLQAATALQEAPTAAAAADEAQAQVIGSRSSNSKQPYWQQLAAAAGPFLRAAYGWMHLDGRPAAAAAAVGYGTVHDSATAVVRPCETPYDCCMMELIHGMLQGPFGRLDSARSRDSALAPACAGAVDSAAAAEATLEVAGTGMQFNSVSQRQMQQQQWEDWCSSNSFWALALLLAAYDKPQQLVRGLVSLVVQQQQQGPTKGTAEAEKAAIRQVRVGRQQILAKKFRQFW
jgi:hypothetical protein